MINIIIDAYPDTDFLTADGFDIAIIGVEEASNRIIYSVDRCVKVLMDQGMSDEEAIEYFDFNVRGSYIGEQTPIWCEDRF